MAQNTYYDDGTPAWSWWGRPSADEISEAPANDVHTIAHGYNLADVQALAHVAARRAIGSYGTHADRYEAAYSGIVTALLTATERPDPRDLTEAGWTSLRRWWQAEARADGRSTDPAQQGKAFIRYWGHAAACTPSPEHGVVERLALWQVWPTLTDVERQAVLALAAAEDYARAASLLGISGKLLRTQLTRARSRFMAAWHEHETPPRARKRDRRVLRRDGLDRHGRPRVTVTQLDRVRERYFEGETIAAIAADTGVPRETLNSLMTGRHRPAPDPADAP